MVGSWIFLVGVVVDNTGPQHSMAAFRHDSLLQMRKIGPASLFNIIQMNVKGEDANSKCWALCLVRNEIVVSLVELVLVGFQKLQVLL
jgi:hypothetical protein